jgi:hypothetical protein
VGDTSALAAFERMFDTGGMSAAPSPLTASAEAVTEARALTQRLSRSLGIPTASSLLDQARLRPVLPALARLFARGGLPQGEAVQMSGRSALSLALACCALTTQDGGWCAGIGLGEPAVSAMQDLGVQLPRVVCLDTPGVLRLRGRARTDRRQAAGQPGDAHPPEPDARRRPALRRTHIPLRRTHGPRPSRRGLVPRQLRARDCGE